MSYGWRERFGMWLAKFHWLDPIMFRYDGIAPGGRSFYVHRVSRHYIIRDV